MTRRAPVDRAGWLEWRRQGLGATDVVAIVGLSRWATPFSVWAEKTGRTPIDDTVPSVEAEFGLRAEAMLAPWFGELTGYHARKWQHRAHHRDWRVGRATLDALVFRTRRSAAPLGPLELKTTDRQPDWTAETFPLDYLAQCQWQMEVTDTDRAWLFALHGRRPVIYPVERDLDDGAWLLDAARRFWRDHVEGDRPPPVHVAPMHVTTEALARMHRIEGAAVELDGGELDLVRRVVATRQHATHAKKAAEAAANDLKARLGDGEIATYLGQPVATYLRRHRKGYTVDPTEYRQLDIRWKEPTP